MEMFTRCSGECFECASSGGCLAGHGDDHFRLASKEKLYSRLGQELMKYSKNGEEHHKEYDERIKKLIFSLLKNYF